MAENQKPQDSEQPNDNTPPGSADRNADEAAATAPEGAVDDQGEDATIEQRLAATEARANEYRDQLLRVRAESENQRKRLERETATALKYAAERVFRDLLAVADSLDLGLKSARDAQASASVLEGLELTQKQLHDTLGKHGVAPLDPGGQPFDPALHEAVSMVPAADVAANHVLEVLQKGYQLHERVLRPARVVVASAPPSQQPSASGESPSGQ